MADKKFKDYYDERMVAAAIMPDTMMMVKAPSTDVELVPLYSLNRITTNTIGASYTITDAQHFSKNLYTGTTGTTVVTLNSDPNSMTKGYFSFHVNLGGGIVEIAYDASLVTVIGHDPVSDPALYVKAIEDDASKGGVQIDYIGFNAVTNKMEYHVYGALA